MRPVFQIRLHELRTPLRLVCAMTMTRIKKLSLLSLIGFLSISALIAVASLLSGDFGSTQVKVILTALTVSGASICAMSYSAFVEKRGLPFLGGTGILFAAIAAFLIIAGIWTEIGKDEYWKMTGSLVVISAAFSHSLLLYIPSLARGFRWTQVCLVISVSLLAILIILTIYGDFRDIGYFRVVGVVAVIVVLLTLIVPICGKLSPAVGLESAGLKLNQEKDDIYFDRDGTRYRVIKI